MLQTQPFQGLVRFLYRIAVRESDVREMLPDQHPRLLSWYAFREKGPGEFHSVSTKLSPTRSERADAKAHRARPGSELFIVDNSNDDWKVPPLPARLVQVFRKTRLILPRVISNIGSLLALADEWQKVDSIRILMGDEVSLRTRKPRSRGARPASQIESRLDASLEAEKDKNAVFWSVCPVIVGPCAPLGKIRCRVLPQRKVPRQVLYHPRPSGSRRFLRARRLVELHLPRNHRKHRTERSNQRHAGRRAARVVRGALERSGGRDGGNPSRRRASCSRVFAIRGLRQVAVRTASAPRNDGFGMGDVEIKGLSDPCALPARRLPRFAREGQSPSWCVSVRWCWHSARRSSASCCWSASWSANGKMSSCSCFKAGSKAGLGKYATPVFAAVVPGNTTTWRSSTTPTCYEAAKPLTTSTACVSGPTS